MFDYPIGILPPFNANVRDKICGDSYWPNDDCSLFMTMTALFHERIHDLKIANRVRSKGYNGNYDDVIEDDSENKLSFYWFATDQDPSSKFSKEFKSFPKHEDYLTKSLGQHIYIKSVDSRNIFIFYERFTFRLYHAVQALAYILFEDIFKEKPITDTERELLVALTKTSDVAYKKEIQKLLENESLKRYLLKSELIGMEKALRKKKYDDAMANVSSRIQEMQDCMNRYANAYEAKCNYENLAYALKAKMDEVEENTEFEDYLCSNKSLTNIRLDRNKISFIVKTFVNPYLPDDWDSLSNNGHIFRNHPSANSCLDDEKNLKLLLDAIFSRDHTLKLRICGYIEMDYFGSRVTSITGYNYTLDNPSLVNYVPNAHLNRHNCFGQNMNDILQQLSDGDMIGAVECCINVVKRMNVAEGASFGPFIDYIKACRGKCIVTEDGQELTCQEAVDYLKEKNNETTSDTAGETSVA